MSSHRLPDHDPPAPDRSDHRCRLHVFVEGHVQGVCFRDSTYREATRLGVCGWVRNLPDGRVEAVYEGPREAIETLLAWTHRGPAPANVTAVHVKDETPEDEKGFTIR